MEVVSKLPLSIPSTVVDLDLLEEEISWKGEVDATGTTTGEMPQERPQARQKWIWVAAELQEVWVVALPLEAKVSEVAKPPPWAAELLQPQMGGLAQPPQDAPVQRVPPNLPASRAPVGHYHLQSGCISSSVGLFHRLFFHLEPASQLFVHLDQGQIL